MQGGQRLGNQFETMTSFTFDLCSVMSCGPNQASWRGYIVYLCYDYMIQHECGTMGQVMSVEQWCPSWGEVVGYTGTQ